MSHLTSDEMIDAVEGNLDPSRRLHVAACAECAGEVESLAAVLREAQAVDVPEPSPLFWNHFTARVRAAVETEPVSAGFAWRGLLRWQILVPYAAMAMVVIAMVVTRMPSVRPEEPIVDQTASVELSDEGWAALADLVGTIDLDTAGDAGLTIVPGTAELAALNLNAQEQQELGRLLQAELERSKS